jgi:hypothetical protein
MEDEKISNERAAQCGMESVRIHRDFMIALGNLGDKYTLDEVFAIGLQALDRSMTAIILSCKISPKPILRQFTQNVMDECKKGINGKKFMKFTDGIKTEEGTVTYVET